MKKVIIATAFCFFSILSFAQSDKYVAAMQTKVAALDTTRSTDGLQDLAHAFERIAAAEKIQWLPYYYAALANVNMGYNLIGRNMKADATQIDPITDKADALINLAEELSKDNSEIYVVKKMIASLRFMVDPQTRYMQYAPKAQAALATAKKLNPENPRVYLLEGQDKFFTPEQFGGSKAEAKKLFEEALQKFEAFKPFSNIDPTWGKGTTNYFLAQVTK